jgi:hypothetical protein
LSGYVNVLEDVLGDDDDLFLILGVLITFFSFIGGCAFALILLFKTSVVIAISFLCKWMLIGFAGYFVIRLIKAMVCTFLDN